MLQRGSSKGSATVSGTDGCQGCGEYRPGKHADTIRAMPDLPSGEWSHLLVGHQWPGSGSLAILSAAAADRAALGSAYDGYADTLQSVRTATLAAQEGMAAESARRSFRLGEAKARDIAARSLAKQKSYTSAHQWVSELRSDLEAIAAGGNSEIRRILGSNDPAPQKISAIVQTVTQAQQQANTRAATCCANLCDAIQTILTAGDAGTSARELARSNGVDLQRAFGSPNLELIHTKVTAMLAEPPHESGAAVGATVTSPPGIAVTATGAAASAPSPEYLAESFTEGANAGAPLSAGAEALTTGAVNAVSAIHPPLTDTAPAVSYTHLTLPTTPYV